MALRGTHLKSTPLTERSVISPLTPRRARATENGLTLIEVIVVLLIITAVVGLVGPQVMGRYESTKPQTTLTQMHMLQSALDTYRLDNNTYPDELGDLIEEPPLTQNWQGPYLARHRSLPRDAWQNDYIYEPEEDGRAYILTSYGADGQVGGENQNEDLTLDTTTEPN